MPNVLQILSSNYSGESVNITFTPLVGDTQTFDNVSLPYNFINDTFDGNYTLFFPNYNLTHEFQIPNVPPIEKCVCTEFFFKSYIGNDVVVYYKSCDGSDRKFYLTDGQSFTDCILIDEFSATTNVNVTVNGYCRSSNDCKS